MSKMSTMKYMINERLSELSCFLSCTSIYTKADTYISVWLLNLCSVLFNSYWPFVYHRLSQLFKTIPSLRWIIIYTFILTFADRWLKMLIWYTFNTEANSLLIHVLKIKHSSLVSHFVALRFTVISLPVYFRLETADPVR